jgi:RimJ/RimL family protein N-acetyltransferase
MFIRSERLFLRPSWPEDWPEILSAISDEAIVRHLALAPWPYTIDDAMAFARLPQDDRFPHFLITLPTGAGSRIIGCIGLAGRDGGVELGYWIAREYWGQGYASEAVRAVIGLAQALGHREVHASHFADNPASARVLEKVGFVWTGEQARRFSIARGAAAPSLAYVRNLGDGCEIAINSMLRAA